MKKITPFLALSFALATSPLFAQDGVLDTSFGNNGITATSLGTESAIYSIDTQSDGKIITTGYTMIQPDNQSRTAFIERFDDNGVLDTNFGNSGHITYSFNDYYQTINNVIVLEDDKFLVVGNDDINSFIFKYNNDGTPDVTFGTNGTLALENNLVITLAVQPDGKIIAGGQRIDFNSDPFSLSRFNSDGSPDLNFGVNGIIDTVINNTVDNAGIGSITIDETGHIIASGLYLANSVHSVIFKYTPDGELDSSFGDEGKILVTTSGNSQEKIRQIVLTSDNKIIAVGDINDFLTVFKYNEDGSPDLNFGNNGINTLLFEGSLKGHLSSISLQEDNKIIIAGQLGSMSNKDLFLARLNDNGTFDNSFGNDGSILMDLNTPIDNIASIEILNDGAILIGGKSTNGILMKFLSGPSLGTIDFTTSANTTFVYSNPLNETSVLEYNLANNEQISIELIDIQGKVIKTYTRNAMQAAGNYKLPLSIPSDLASGTYMLTLSSAEGKAAIKVIK